MTLPRSLRSSSSRSILTLASIGAAAAAITAMVLPTHAEPAGPNDRPHEGPPRGAMMEHQGPGRGPGGPGGRDGSGGPGGPGGPQQGFQQGPRGGGPEHRPQRQPVALAGKIERYNLAPQGLYDAILLRAGEKLVQVNLPPDLGGMIALAAPVGSNVQISARPELGMPDHPVYALASLTAADGHKIDLDARPKDLNVEGVVKQLNYSPVGDVNGVILENGDFVHLGPEGAAEVKVGQKLTIEGRTRGASLGGNAIEAQSVNGKAIPRPPRPMGGPGMGGPGMGGPGMGGPGGQGMHVGPGHFGGQGGFGGPGGPGQRGGPEGFGPGDQGRRGPGGGMHERGGPGGKADHDGPDDRHAPPQPRPPEQE